MSDQGARIAVLPRALASEVITSAISRAAWTVSLVVLLLDIPVLIDVLVSRGHAAALPTPLLALAAMVILLLVTSVRPSTLSRVTFLALGAALAGVYEVSILLADPALNSSGTFVLNRAAFVLVLVGPGIVRPISGLIWCASGFVVSMATLFVSAIVAGVAVIPGGGPAVSFGIYASALIALAIIRLSQASQIPDLAKLELETRKLDLDHQFEQRAAAVIHDTVLNDLSIVMNAQGTLPERTRERFRTDVATLSDGAWLRESRASLDVAPEDDALRNRLLALVSELQWRGLTVDITGIPLEMVRLSPKRAIALEDAVRACLENVLFHADTARAELAISTERDSVTVMVIDHGRGFDPHDVADDRLGLRTSVIHRIESLRGSVKVWSRIGSGTSVVIALPAEVGENAS